ncbi:MAG: acetylxylan esterase [Planctomycetes bacterium]|nr:acetylxylan esterase [Planctomycetota bacterium]
MPKTERSVNLYDTLQAWCREWRPDCSFDGRTEKDYRRWRAAFSRHYRRCLGPWPGRVNPRLEVVERVERPDHLREKVLFDSSERVTVPAYLLTPRGLRPGDRRPGILAAHGHGDGKADICGVSREKNDENVNKRLDTLNYEYAVEAVRRGFVVIAPDWCPFGERRPPPWWCRPNRDPCNITDLAWQYFGRPLITQSIWDGMRAVDVLAKHPNVDPRRIGVIGLSQGGTMTTHLLINDRRLRAGVVSGYISTVRVDALNERGRGNTCGAQHVPGLLLHGDIPDMLGLAAPKPVLFEIGRKETCFHYPDMMKAYRHLRTIYEAAGALDRIAADVHPNDHRWSGKKAWSWLERWL